MQHRAFLLLVPVAAFSLGACSSGSVAEPTVTFPSDLDASMATPEFVMPTEDLEPDSPVMVEIKDIGIEIDTAIREEAAALGLSQATLSAETLERLISESGWSEVASVVGGRVQVSKDGESICLLLGGDQDKPAFLEERTCL